MQKIKSIPALVLGILGSIFSLGCILILILLYIVGSISAELNDGSALFVISVVALMAVTLACVILGIVASAYVLRRARISAFLYLTATVLSFAVFIDLVVSLQEFSLGIAAFIPSLTMFLLAAIFAFCAKPTPHANSPTDANISPNSNSATPPNTKSAPNSDSKQTPDSPPKFNDFSLNN